MIFEKNLIELALAEDLGLGDITTDSVVNSAAEAVGLFVAREDMVVSGMDVVRQVFQYFAGVDLKTIHADGESIQKGAVLCEVSGNAQNILKGERLALNFLRRLCGIATFTRSCVDELRGSSIKICDTRKTTPGWRRMEKHAVRCGGGMNHRFSLADTVMIKDNHVVCTGGIQKAIELALAVKPHTSKIQVEVDDLDQLAIAVQYPIDLVLLDNMSPKMVEKALAIIPKGILTEASGGITLETLKTYKHLKIDRISMGALTGSAAYVDIGLDFKVG